MGRRLISVNRGDYGTITPRMGGDLQPTPIGLYPDRIENTGDNKGGRAKAETAWIISDRQRGCGIKNAVHEQLDPAKMQPTGPFITKRSTHVTPCGPSLCTSFSGRLTRTGISPASTRSRSNRA